MSLTIGKARSFLYAFARLLGDVNAVKRGKVGKRIANRLIGRTMSRRVMRKLWLR